MKNKNAQISLEILAILGIVILGSVMVGVYYISNINSKISTASTILDPIDDFQTSFGEISDPVLIPGPVPDPEPDPNDFYYFDNFEGYPVIDDDVSENTDFEIELIADTNFDNILISNIDIYLYNGFTYNYDLNNNCYLSGYGYNSNYEDVTTNWNERADGKYKAQLTFNCSEFGRYRFDIDGLLFESNVIELRAEDPGNGPSFYVEKNILDSFGVSIISPIEDQVFEVNNVIPLVSNVIGAASEDCMCSWYARQTSSMNGESASFSEKEMSDNVFYFVSDDAGVVNGFNIENTDGWFGVYTATCNTTGYLDTVLLSDNYGNYDITVNAYNSNTDETAGSGSVSIIYKDPSNDWSISFTPSDQQVIGSSAVMEINYLGDSEINNDINFSLSVVPDDVDIYFSSGGLIDNVLFLDNIGQAEFNLVSYAVGTKDIFIETRDNEPVANIISTFYDFINEEPLSVDIITIINDGLIDYVDPVFLSKYDVIDNTFYFDSILLDPIDIDLGDTVTFIPDINGGSGIYNCTWTLYNNITESTITLPWNCNGPFDKTFTDVNYDGTEILSLNLFVVDVGPTGGALSDVQLNINLDIPLFSVFITNPTPYGNYEISDPIDFTYDISNEDIIDYDCLWYLDNVLVSSSCPYSYTPENLGSHYVVLNIITADNYAKITSSSFSVIGCPYAYIFISSEDEYSFDLYANGILDFAARARLIDLTSTVEIEGGNCSWSFDGVVIENSSCDDFTMSLDELSDLEIDIPDGTSDHYVEIVYTYNLSNGEEIIFNASSNYAIDIPVSGCPQGYVFVPNNLTYNTGDFCVMQFEAKIDEDDDGVGDNNISCMNPSCPDRHYWMNQHYPDTCRYNQYDRDLVSSANGYPLVNLSLAQAISACQYVGGDYHLINNDEWMTIARNIELQPENWTGNEVYSGSLYIGNNGGSCNVLDACYDGDNPEYTPKNASDVSARLIIDNGFSVNEIWDLSGNVKEWVDKTIIQPNMPQPPGYALNYLDVEDFGSEDEDTYLLLNYNLDSFINGVGSLDTVYQPTGVEKAWIRGGQWGDGSNAGILRLNLNYIPNNTYKFGFRCVSSIRGIVTIDIPSSGGQYYVGREISFESTNNLDDDVQYSWDSNIENNVLSTAEDFTTSNLIEGTHLITLTVTDTETGSVFSRQTIIHIDVCPDGYVLVPNDPNYDRGDFCVMKYEAKVDYDSDGVGDSYPFCQNGSYRVWDNRKIGCSYTESSIVSTILGYPLTYLTQPESKAACESIGDNYHLITNYEWMTIARNIESQADNWSDGTVGSGFIPRGNSDNIYALDDYTVLPAEINQRNLILSNGNEIYDLAGNVHEWVDKIIAKRDMPQPGTTLQYDNISNYGLFGRNAYNFAEGKDYSSANGVGKLCRSSYDDESFVENVFLRGGYWDLDSTTGILSLDLRLDSSDQGYSYGFRCVFGEDPINVTIDTPLNGDQYRIGDVISFESTNNLDGDSIQYSWDSNLENNVLSTVEDFTTSSLIGGTHLITLTVTDTEIGLVFSRQTIISIDVCPDGYVLVPNDPTYGTGDFCVMKFEAKVDNTDNGIGDSYDPCESSNYDVWDDHKSGCSYTESGRSIVSTIDGFPLVYLTQPESKVACESIGAHLITNNEWMTIARNIESQANNWSDGEVGLGYIPRGNCHQNSWSAIDDATNYYPDAINQRNLILSNGNEIYDLAGNVNEWVDQIITKGCMPQPGTTLQYDSISNYGEGLGSLGRESYNFAIGKNYDYENGIGQMCSEYLEGSTSEIVFVRGGSWYSSDYMSGILRLNFLNDSSDQWYHIGFRCSRVPLE